MMLQIVNQTGSQKIDDALAYFKEKYSIILNQIYDLPEKNYFTYTVENNRECVRKFSHYLAVENTVTIRPYKAWFGSSVIGYTQYGQYYINMRKINKLSFKDYASNIGHELSHFAGFSHPYYYTSSRKYSFPYAFGYLFNNSITLTELQNHKWIK